MNPIAKHNQNSDGYKPDAIPKALRVIKGHKEGKTMDSLDNHVRTMNTQEGSRLEKRVGSIFIHVSDMKRAVEWYSRVFDLPYNDDYIEGRLSTVYTLHFEGTEVLLDNNGGAEPRPQPMMFFKTDDIRQTLQFLKQAGVVIHKEVLDNNIVIFEDPDGNRLMAIQM